MTRVVKAFLVLFALVTCAVTFEASDQAQRAAMADAAARVGVPFVVPDAPAAAEPGHVLRAIQDAATQSGVNVFRTQRGYSAQGVAETRHYVLLVGSSAFFQPFTLSHGRFLTPADMGHRGAFMATTDTAAAGQVGAITDLGNNDHVRVEPFAAVYDSLPTAGLYYVEPVTGTASLATFEAAFVHRLNALSPDQPPLTPAYLHAGSAPSGASVDGLARLLLAGQYLLIVITLVLLAYHQLAESKRSGVLRLHGYGPAGIWWAVSGRLMATALGGTVAVLTLLSRAVPGASWAFSREILLRLVIGGAAMVFVSLIAGTYVFRSSLASALKNRKDTGRVFALNTGLKALFSIALVVTGAGLVQQYQLAADQRSALGDWSATRDYAIFYPSSVGNDTTEVSSGLPGPAAAEVFDLYPAANADGALYIDATQFESVALAQPLGPGAYRSLTVNPNYLRQYPVHATDGMPVRVPESTTEWVVLVPSSLRSREPEITAYFQTTRTGHAGSGGVAASEKSVFGRDVSTAIRKQKVRIIWTAAGQDIFSFDPEVEPGRGNRVRDPIIQVMTLANSAGVDRENAVTGAASTALKIRLHGGDPAATLAELAPLLTTSKLDDNLRHLITMSGYHDSQRRVLDDGIRSILIVGATLALIMAALVAQGLSVAFDRYSRRVVVRRLFGHPVTSRYREFLRVLTVLWAAQLTVALVANAAGASPFTTDTSHASAPAMNVILIATLTIAGECLASIAILALIERRRMADVLKREF